MEDAWIGDVAGLAGGQLGCGTMGGAGLASASVRGRCDAACRPPPERPACSGAPMVFINSGTWLGSTTYTISRRRPGRASTIRPPITSRLPSISKAQVDEFSQPGRISAVAARRTPGWAPRLMMTRLYAPSRRSAGFQSRSPAPALVQKASAPGRVAGGRAPATVSVTTGSAPVPMSIELTAACGTPAR
jgi:hypothetical protein